MEPTPFEVTSEHIERRFNTLERRIGLAALMVLVERNARSIEDPEEYARMVGNPDYESDDAEDEADETLEIEIREAFGHIDGYYLAEVTASTVMLIKQLQDPESFRPTVRLTYDTINNRYEKTYRRVTGNFEAAKPEVQPVTNEDRAIMTVALAKIAQINHGLLADSPE